jgi:hypothetical protein
LADRVPLGSLIPERLDSVAERVRTKLGDNQEIGGMKLAWDFIGDQLLDALKSVLDCDLLEVLGGAWAKAAPLADFADPDKHPPGERSVVEIGEHDVSRELNPVIAVTIGSCPCVELSFTLALSAHVGGVRLSIVDGHIVGGDLGELWASAQLSYEGVPLHPVQESAKIAVPGAFEFAPPGIKIPRLSSVAVEGAADGG